MVDDYRVYSFNFIDENHKEALYWRDVGTLEAYYEANMDVASVSPVLTSMIRAGQSVVISAIPAGQVCICPRVRTGMAFDSVISQGCIVSGGSVRDSVLSPDVRVIPMLKSTPASCSAMSVLDATAASAKPLSIGMCNSPKEASLATTQRPIARNILSPKAALRS